VGLPEANRSRKHRPYDRVVSDIAVTLVAGGIGLVGVVVGALLSYRLTLRTLRQQVRIELEAERRHARRKSIDDMLTSDERKGLSWASRSGAIDLNDLRNRILEERNLPKEHFACVANSSLVATPSGPISADRVQVGDELLDWDEEKQSTVETKVTVVRSFDATEMLRVNGAYEMTPTHVIRTPDGGGVRARQLRLFNLLRSAAGSLIVRSVVMTAGAVAIGIRTETGGYLQVNELDQAEWIQVADEEAKAVVMEPGGNISYSRD
jgi:hypothetical protein